MSGLEHEHPPDSPPPPSPGAHAHSRAATAPAAVDDQQQPASLSASSTYMSSMWTGLIRRFSSEETSFPSQMDSADDGSGPHHGIDNHYNLHHHLLRADGVNGVFNPAKRTASPFRPPPLDPLILRGYRDGTTRLLSTAVAEEIRAMVPERLRIAEDWKLVYSLEQDGASLSTLYQKCRVFERLRVGFVLVVKDQEGGTFGAYLSDYPHPAPSYFGNGECFLWRASMLAPLPPPPSADTTNVTRSTTLAPSSTSSFTSPRSPTATPPPPRSGASTPGERIRFKAFPYSGLNDFYINCEAGFLSVGSGGGHYGLWLDDSLDVGHSAQSETFGNEPLSDEGPKFGVLGVELWVIGRLEVRAG